jgi:protein-disulfide isomerase
MAIGLVALAIAITITATEVRTIYLSPGSTNNPLEITPLTPVRGSPGAPVTIFEFGDFQCTYCHQWFLNTEPQLLQNYVDTGKAKLVWKDFDYYGPDSTTASQAAYAAGEQGKFWQFYDYLYSHQQTPNSGWASKTNLLNFAQSLGLNMTQFSQSLDSGKYASLISSNFSAGQKQGVKGTPTFVIEGLNGQTVQLVGAQPYSAFQIAISSVGG